MNPLVVLDRNACKTTNYLSEP
uniref:Uncharacterized protein n=1 Tax=Anguilla anguilla TaxID=7936 RepID=A0A0E9VA87_ANGAN